MSQTTDGQTTSRRPATAQDASLRPRAHTHSVTSKCMRSSEGDTGEVHEGMVRSHARQAPYWLISVRVMCARELCHASESIVNRDRVSSVTEDGVTP